MTNTLTTEQLETIQGAFDRVSKYLDITKIDQKFASVEGIKEQINNGASTVLYFDADMEEPNFKIAIRSMTIGK